ncbi:MAG TPA: glycoside hydrolase family 3 N-terminal domain-containing protein [Blastocatellia bacterium]|nr:glycoside hydrolase family 3 N-terminal domain-containing protein [Blastocatellia bacterium]
MGKMMTVLFLAGMSSQGLGVQMERAAPAQPNSRTRPAVVDYRAPVAEEVLDSQIFFEAALKAGNQVVDFTSQVEALLAQMTLEEKVGQMTQLEIGMVSNGKGAKTRIDPAKLEKAVVKYGIGSIINVTDEAFTIDQWHELIRQIQESAQRARLKIPVLYGIDSIHGVNYTVGSTLFPQEIGMAATWNPELMKRAAEITALETRACGIPWNFSPVLDLGRQQLWPRFYETFGEDPYLARVMGVAAVRGYEGTSIAANDHVATCLKHYIGYSFPLTGKDRSPAWISENYLREYFMPTFQAAIEAGARTIMVNSGDINGVPGHASYYLLTDVLRNELGFRGIVVSDWEDIKKLVTQHRIAATEKEATRIAVMAGIDMSMVPSDYSFSDNLVALVKEGAVPQSRVDEAVARILRLKFELGLFASPMPDITLKSKLGSADSRAVSLQAARESITLLKSSGNLLPLAKGAKVLVTGPTADSLVSLNNGWSYTWQGTKSELYPKDRLTIRGAIEARAGKQNVRYVPGSTLDKEINIAEAAEAAHNADVVIVCLGEGAYAETPGNIEDLTLGDAQLKLAAAVAVMGKPVVLVLVEGRPRIISRIADGAQAILMAYNPSNEGGQAITDVLFGDYNPGGKLPFTYARYANAQIPYDHKPYELQDIASAPQFEFGYGLSYTTFAYSNLRVEPKTASIDAEITVSVTVKNTGGRTGNESVQLYVSDLVASITPPGKRLKRFAKIHLEPGQSKNLRFTLRPNDLSFVGPKNKPIVEPGEFEVAIAGLTARFTLSQAP